MKLFKINYLKNLSLLLLLVFSLTGCESESTRPNIIFIMTDDHANSAISAYGSKITSTPNIDRLANEGMRFENSFCTNAICGPSRAVLLTGKYSHLNGQINNGVVFDSTQQTFPKLLQQAGYQTAMIGKWHLRSQPTGFDYWNVLPGQGSYYNPDFIEMGQRKRLEGYVTDLTTDIALNWLQQRDQEKPFCLLLHHKAPHRNWMPGPKHTRMFEGEEIPLPDTYFDTYEKRLAAQTQEMRIDRHAYPGSDLKLPLSLNSNPDSLREDQLFWKSEYARMTGEQQQAWDAVYRPRNEAFVQANLTGRALAEAKYQRYVKDYLRCIASVDDNIGRVLDYLDEAGLSENTIVVYTSDQGFYLGEHGWFDKRFMYEPSLKMPLIVRYPGNIQAASSSNQMALNLDFAPTFLDYAGVDIPTDIQGRSLKHLLSGNAPADWRQSIYYHYYEFPATHMVKRHYGVRTDRYKLIRFYYDIDSWEFFDLEKDPEEIHNLYDDPAYSEVINELKTELTKLRKEYQDSDTDKYMPQAPVLVSHLAQKKPVALEHPPAAKYNGGGANALTDGNRAPDRIYYGSDYRLWQGFEADDLIATIDLGKNTAIRSISAGFLQHVRDWIFLPVSIEFSASEDGQSFQPIGNIENQIPQRKKGAFRESFTLENLSTTARYIRVHARNLKTCPDWHPGAGGKTWIFADEIVVK